MRYRYREVVADDAVPRGRRVVAVELLLITGRQCAAWNKEREWGQGEQPQRMLRCALGCWPRSPCLHVASAPPSLQQLQRRSSPSALCSRRTPRARPPSQTFASGTGRHSVRTNNAPDLSSMPASAEQHRQPLGARRARPRSPGTYVLRHVRPGDVDREPRARLRDLLHLLLGARHGGERRRPLLLQRAVWALSGGGTGGPNGARRGGQARRAAGARGRPMCRRATSALRWRVGVR